MERRLAIVRVLYKFIQTCCFVFDKAGKIRGQVGLCCAFLCLFIVYKRATAALIFKTSVFYATIFYEVNSFILYFAISLHTLSGTRLTISSLALLLSFCFLASLTMILIQS
jgi:hypothetical protein